MNEAYLLNDVCELIVDCEHKTAPTQETGYPSIRTPNIGRGNLILDKVKRVSEETYKKWTKRAIPKTDDLILAREAPVGNVAIVPRNLKVCLGQRTVLIRPNKNKIHPHYLCYLLLGDEVQGKISSLSNGATVHHLNMGDIRNLELPQLPPLLVQNKIASVISAYDDLIENNNRRIKILESMAQTLYQEWFVKFRFPGHKQVKIVESELGLIPEGWEVVQIKDFGKVITGKTPSKKKPEYYGEYMPFIKTPSMHGNTFCIEVEEYLSELGVASQKNKTIPENSIIVNCIGALAGSVSITSINSQMNQQINAVVLNSNNYREFLYLTLSNLKETIRQHGSNGATMINLSKGKFEALKTLLPEQKVLSQFNKITQHQFDLIKNLQLRNINLCKTRDLLLPKLISGQIDVENLDIDTGEIAA